MLQVHMVFSFPPFRPFIFAHTGTIGSNIKYFFYPIHSLLIFFRRCEARQLSRANK